MSSVDDPTTATPPAASSAPRTTVTGILTKLAHGSAPFISTFLLIHLSAPALANLGGSSLSSQVMLLGREYYQTAAGHALLVSLPILVHTASGIAKRVASPQRARRLTSLFTLTGYATLAFFLPIHYLLHRVYPRDPAAPVYELAPSELDFEYVKYGLQRWPWRSWFLYAGLTVCVAWHAAEGMQIIWNTWLRGSFGGWKSSWGKRLATVAAVVVPTLSGLYVVFREPLMAFTSSLARYEGAFTKSFVFKL